VGSNPCRWALPFVVGLYPPALGSALRRWALPSGVGLCSSSLGFTLRRWVLPFVLGVCPSPCRLRPFLVIVVWSLISPHRTLYALCSFSFGSTAHPVALRLVVRIHVASGGHMLRCSTLRRIVSWNPYRTVWLSSNLAGSLASSLGHSIVVVAVAVVGGKCSVGLDLVSGRLRREGWEKTNHDEHRGSSGDAPNGPPIPWVPPRIPPSPIPPSSELEPPTSLWTGEGRMERGRRFRVR